MIPEGFSAGPARLEDAAEATAVINAHNRAHAGEAIDAETEQDTVDWWSQHDLDRDTVALRDPAGRLAAFGVLETRGRVLELDGYVLPGRTGLGLGGALAAWLERETRERGMDTARGMYLGPDAAAERLFRGRGYRYARSFYRMVADVEAPPPAPAWPAGCAVSVPEPGDEHDVHDVLEEAFAEHWGHVERGYDRWLAHMRGFHPDPSLWFLVRAGGEPAAAAVCAAQRFGTGWIGVLGVRPAWRRRGIARALLLHSFGELYARGERRMSLGVDADNDTGATRLYESVGMRVAWRADLCELPVDG